MTSTATDRSSTGTSSIGNRVVAAVDKFRGTATAADVAAAIARACHRAGHSCIELPLADGGEGLIDALGGPNRTTRVSGPLGAPVDAGWRFVRGTAVIEMARASGLALAGHAEGNDAVNATTAGTGQLIDAALRSGAERIVVGVGGSATTDGGIGAVEAIADPARLRRVDLLVACDVTTTFTQAAEVYGPQKGASPAQVRDLTRRLEQLARRYRAEYGVDVDSISGSGAAGGLAGGLAARGGTLVPGFDLVADELRLDDTLARVDLVVTGEGHLDAQSFHGKVVGGVADRAAQRGLPLVAIAGVVDPDVAGRLPTYSLVDLFGRDDAVGETLRCIEEATAIALTTFAASSSPLVDPNGTA